MAYYDSKRFTLLMDGTLYNRLIELANKEDKSAPKLILELIKQRLREENEKANR